jgi:hypothetical protein
MNSLSFPHDTQVNFTLVARLLLLSVAQKLCKCEQGVFILKYYFASKLFAAILYTYIRHICA